MEERKEENIGMGKGRGMKKGDLSGEGNEKRELRRGNKKRENYWKGKEEKSVFKKGWERCFVTFVHHKQNLLYSHIYAPCI